MTVTLSRDEWAAVVDDAGRDPSVGEVARSLVDADEIGPDEIDAAEAAVETALDAGTLRETDDGMFGSVVVPDGGAPSDAPACASPEAVECPLCGESEELTRETAGGNAHPPVDTCHADECRVFSFTAEPDPDPLPDADTDAVGEPCPRCGVAGSVEPRAGVDGVARCETDECVVENYLFDTDGGDDDLGGDTDDSEKDTESGGDDTGDTADPTDPFDRGPDGYINDPGFDGSRSAVRDHYRQSASVADALAVVGDDYPCLAHPASSGWYTYRPTTDPDVIEAGWDSRSRPLVLRDDWSQIVSDAGTDGSDRVIYQIASWDHPDGHQSRLLKRTDDGKQYRDRKPTPNFDEKRAIGFWVDFDLADRLKPQRGRLPDRDRAVVERAAAELIDRVGQLYDVPSDAVYALDSGGGMYIFGPPEASLPVARLFDDDRARNRVMSEWVDRINDWAKEAWSEVCDRVDGAAELCDPDFVQNVNRMSKAPASLHGDHDLVCTPLRPRDPDTGEVAGSVDYTPTLPSQFDDAERDACVAWADGLTDTAHTDAVSAVVSRLWPTHDETGQSWAHTLRSWLRDVTHDDAARATADAAADADAERREARRDDGDSEADDNALADAPVTPSRRRVDDAVDRLDTERVAEETVVHRWTDSVSGLTDRSGDNKRAFVPTWGPDADSGNANYVDNNRGNWVDTGDGSGGDPVTMALVAADEITHTESPDAELRSVGRQWLRENGFAVPEYTPDAETTNPDTGEPYDRMPLWSLRAAAVALDVCDRGEFVRRDPETGRPVDDDHDGDTYLGFPDGATYNAALTACREVGLVPGREQWATDDDRPTPGDDRVDDPTEIDVALRPATAWRAADAVAPDDLDADPTAHNGVSVSRDGEAWVCDHSGARLTVVDAAAVATGLVPHGEAEIDADAYTRAYEWARTEWDAPLPEYVDGETVTERWDLVSGALRQLQFDHFDRDEINSDVQPTDRDELTAVIDPAWRQSGEGESVLVYESGTVYECDPAIDRKLRPLEFVALDAGLVSWADVAADNWRLSGDDWSTAYWLARTVYGAPLPAWDGRTPRHTAVLPDPPEIGGDADATDRLQAAREAVAEVYDDAASQPGADVLGVLPALGKTHQVAAQADEHPAFYGAPRKELMLDMIDRCRDHGRSWYVLPTFGETNPPEAVVRAGVDAVRDEGQNLLRDRDRLVDATEERLAERPSEWDSVPDPEAGPDDDSDNDERELPRTSCPTADGDHGRAWWLAVHVARSRASLPGYMHTNVDLFGDPLPCACDGCAGTGDNDHDHHDDERCAYSQAWDDAADPDHPYDVLIGHYTLANVPTARSYIHRSDEPDSDRPVTEPRVVALDEFPGDAFTREFGPEWRDHARWAGAALDDGVEDSRDVSERDLWDDDHVRGWIDGDPVDALGELADTLAMLRDCLAEPAVTAGRILDSRRRPPRTDAVESLQAVRSLGLASPKRLHDTAARLGEMADDDRDRRASREITEIGESLSTLRTRLQSDGHHSPASLLSERLTAVGDRLGGTLGELVDDAVRALASGDAETAVATLDTASRALRGGRDGCERLAAWGDDGDAHPLAHTLLAAAACPRDADESTVVSCPSFAPGGDARDHEPDDTARVQRVAVGGTTTVLADRAGHGATVNAPPSWSVDGAGESPVVGLDATARRRLWSLALGTDCEVRDVHDDARERRQFIRDVYGVSVVQTSDAAHYYEGDVSSIDLDGPSELLREIDRTHGEPAAGVTTKTVENVIDARDDAPTAETAHYGDLTGSERLADHNVAALLGCQHWGDAHVERWAALAGEEAHRTGHGMELSYQSAVADDALGLMRDDQVLQALLRFGREASSGVTVYAHTAALRDDVPVVDRGEVVRTYSETAQAVAETAAGFSGRWTRADLQAALRERDDADSLATSPSRLRGILRDLRTRGYVETVAESDGRATVYGDATTSGPGEVSLPDTGNGPPETDSQYTYTWSHRVDRSGTGVTPRSASQTATLPAPETAAAEIGDGPPGS